MKNSKKTPTQTKTKQLSKSTGVINGEDLSELHKLIIDEWFTNGYNKSRAVMQHSEGVNNQSGAVHIFNAIVSKPKAKKYITSLQARLRGSNHISREQVAAKLTEWAFADATEVLGNTPEELEIKALPSHVRASIQAVKVTTKTETNRQGNEVTTKSVDFKLINKLDALDKYAKIIGAYEIDNNQKKGITDLTNVSQEAQKALFNAMMLIQRDKNNNNASQ